MSRADHSMTVTQPFEFENLSTSWKTLIKSLFSFISVYGVLYKHNTDFWTGRGTYTTVLDCKFTKISRERNNFGTLPNRIAIDMVFYPKIITAIKAGELKPHTLFDELIVLFDFLLGVTFMFWSWTEHAMLNWRNFQFLKVASGKNSLGWTKLGIVVL